MICLLHGYLLDGSGSNIYVQNLARTFCELGRDVHVVCQEGEPETFDFVFKAMAYDEKGNPRIIHEKETPYLGKCFLHRPFIGEMLPVFVWNRYKFFKEVKTFLELSDEELDTYVARNVRLLIGIVKEYDISHIHANHLVMMPVIASKVKGITGTPFLITPHGSAIEYVVKRDKKYYRFAQDALEKADRIVIGNQEVTQRIIDLYPHQRWHDKIEIINVGVDTHTFKPIKREERPFHIERLLEDIPEGGKSFYLTKALLEKVETNISLKELTDILTQEGKKYSYECPDSDLKDKFKAVDWENERIVLYVGKLIVGKGIHNLIMAIPKILKEHPKTRFVLVGSGSYRETLEIMLYSLSKGMIKTLENLIEMGRELDGQEREPLTRIKKYLSRQDGAEYFQLAQGTNPWDHTIFAGYLSHEKLKYLLPCADICIIPSEVPEAYPLTLLESISAGVLPMVSYFSGLADGIDQIIQGLPTQVGDLLRISVDEEETIQEIVHKVNGLLDVKESYVHYCRQIALERYSWKAICQSLLKLYDTLA